MKDKIESHMEGFKNGKFADLLVNNDLYRAIDISVEDFGEILFILTTNYSNDYQIECYCYDCKDKSFFQLIKKDKFCSKHYFPQIKSKLNEYYRSFMNQYYCLEFECISDRNHKIHFDLFLSNDKAKKIGQYPSIETIKLASNYRYRYYLSEYYDEYIKAIGLYQNNIGIGSFVYMRRIIEKLTYNAFKEAVKNENISEIDFLNKGVVERIKQLRNYLPAILVDNPKLYGILSKGIHELDEETCLEIFPCVKLGIELILDEIITKQVKKEKEHDLELLFSNELNKHKKKGETL